MEYVYYVELGSCSLSLCISHQPCTQILSLNNIHNAFLGSKVAYIKKHDLFDTLHHDSKEIPLGITNIDCIPCHTIEFMFSFKQLVGNVNIPKFSIYVYEHPHKYKHASVKI